MLTYDKYRELTEKNANRNAVIEECARVAEAHGEASGVRRIIAAAIRALKDR